MEIIHGLSGLTQPNRPTAVAIGNFDGVHLGHRKILEFLVEEARANNLMSLVLTFWPHPGKITHKDQIRLIQTLEQRLEKISQFNIQTAITLPFTKRLANLSAHNFISQIIIQNLRAKIIIVGENFYFGKNREGSIKILRTLAANGNFSVHSIPSVSRGNTIISSTIIRRLIEKGQILQANNLLGDPFEIRGKVIKGKSRGAVLGFPTANISTKNEIIPQGVFITKVILEGKSFPSLTNVGTSPTFAQKESKIETHILDFNGKLYGNKIKIQFLDKIRDEKKFDSPEKLSQQIQNDLEHARNFFFDRRT